MNNSQQDPLEKLFGFWKQVADETERSLPEDAAGVFLFLFNDALDMIGAIHDAYPQEEVIRSLVYAEFTGLLKELLWLHALFVCGNYRLVLSQLRFNWERIFRARYADAYAEEHPEATDAPEPNLDEKHDWLTKREGRLNWQTLIAPTLAKLFSAGTPEEVESRFKPLWDRLNRCVHPTGELCEKLIANPDAPLHAIDAFDEAWARETCREAAEVFSLLWLAVLSRFPEAVPALLADPHSFEACPQIRASRVLPGD